MKLEDIPRLYREVWAAYEALRRVGFRDDDISYLMARQQRPDGTVTDEEVLLVRLTAQGKEFNVVVGPLDRSFEDARALLDRVMAAIADGSVTDADGETMWRQSAAGSVAGFLALGGKLVERGFILPALVN